MGGGVAKEHSWEKSRKCEKGETWGEGAREGSGPGRGGGGVDRRFAGALKGSLRGQGKLTGGGKRRVWVKTSSLPRKKKKPRRARSELKKEFLV